MKNRRLAFSFRRSSGVLLVGLSLSFGVTACGSSDEGGATPAGSGASGGSVSTGGQSAAAGNAGTPIGNAGTGNPGGGATSSGGAGNAGSGTTAGAAGTAPAGGGATGSAGSGSGGATDVPLGAVAYKQTFDALKVGLWTKNLDGAKIKAHPENAAVATACGSDNSQCFRVTYRHADGIHKQPPSSPVFSGSGTSTAWTDSDSGHSNTATDVIQANISIDGTVTGHSTASAKAVPSKAYTLSYQMYFEPGFDFAKGGKLPGLAAAAFDSGCTEDGSDKRQTSNWSERLMWRANGRLQLYSYDQSRASGSCGVEMTIDWKDGEPKFEQPGLIPNDDKFRLKAGVWYSVQLSVRVNDNNSVKYKLDASGQPEKDADGYIQPISGNGAVALYIKSADGSQRRQIVFNDVALRDECDGPCPATVPDSPESLVNGVFFSTFYGGNETKRTTCVDEAKSTLTTVVPAAMPSYPGLTQPVFDKLCSTQKNTFIFPKLTWNPQTPSAVRFDNFVVTQGFTTAAIP